MRSSLWIQRMQSISRGALFPGEQGTALFVRVDRRTSFSLQAFKRMDADKQAENLEKVKDKYGLKPTA